jgi:K+-transporting ATPase ATPase C chain
MKSDKNTGKTIVVKHENNPPGGSLLGHLWSSIAVTLTLGIICCAVYPAIIYFLSQAIFPVQANGSLLKKDGSFTSDDSQAVGSALIGQPFTAPQYFHPRPSAANNSPGASYSPTGGYDATDSGGTNMGPLSDELINGATTQPSAPATQPTAAATAPTTAPAVAAATSAPAATQPAEVLAYDGVRLRAIHYANDNGIPFKLFQVTADGTRTEVPLKKYQNADGSLMDTALVDAFPHNGVTAGLIADDFATLIPGDAVTASGSGVDPHISPANANLQAQRVATARNVSVDQVKTLIDKYTDKPDLGFLGDAGVNVLRLNLALDNTYPMPAPPATQPAAH